MVNSKQKGNAWENKIAKEVREYFLPSPFFDNLTDKQKHALLHRTPMSGGHVERGDLIIKPPIWESFPWFVECRNRESWSWKNIMEKGFDSTILTWYREDARDKCHPYDNNQKYYRYPLLLFTCNQQKTYFCAAEMDIYDVLADIENHGDMFLDLGPTLVMINSQFVIGLFDNLLMAHAVDVYAIQERLVEYLGDDDYYGTDSNSS